MYATCTIVNRNYLPQALVQYDSLQQTNQHIDHFILITDGEPVGLNDIYDGNLISMDELSINNERMLKMRSYYDEVELATALKPTLLRTLLGMHYETVTFLDPDTLIFDSLEDSRVVANSSGIALTPHRITPSDYNFSDYPSAEMLFLKYGIYNLGFISVSQKACDMLIWWEEKLFRFGSRKSKFPIFTDQKWVDLVPSYFDHFILKHAGYNIAYWNIDERNLTEIGGKFFANGSPLIFIHFSQMSGVLASGEGTPLWDLSLRANHPEALKIINTLTYNYTQELAVKKEILATKKIIKSKHKSKSHGRYGQSILINSSRHGIFWVSKFLVPLLDSSAFKYLERSNAYTGFFDGLGNDLNKFLTKIRNFLK